MLSHTLGGYTTGSQKQSLVRNTVSSLVGQCPKVAVRVGGVVVNCQLDTESMVSTMVDSFFSQHFQGSSSIVIGCSFVLQMVWKFLTQAMLS